MHSGEDFVAARPAPRPARAGDRAGGCRRRRSRCAAASRPSARWSASIAARRRAEPQLRRRRARGAGRALLEPAALALDNALLLRAGRGAVGHRRPDAALQLAVPEPVAAARDQARRRAAAGRCRCCSSTSTGSRRSTTPTATCAAAARWSKRPPSSAAAPAKPTSSPGSAATSSRSSCPTPGVEGAVAVAERIRDRIAAHHVSWPATASSIRLTASVGVATLPDVAAYGRRAGAGGRRGDVPGEGSRARTAFTSPAATMRRAAATEEQEQH